MEGSGQYCVDIWLKGLRKTLKKFSQDSQSEPRFEPTRAEYEKGVTTTRL
jgi:hypothetical protein